MSGSHLAQGLPREGVYVCVIALLQVCFQKGGGDSQRALTSLVWSVNVWDNLLVDSCHY